MASAGWYPDPGGQPNTYRYWDGKAWSAVTSPNPAAPPPSTALGATPGVSQSAGQIGNPQSAKPWGQQGQPGSNPYAQQGAQGQQGYTQGQPGAWANYQQTTKKRGPVGWWIGIGALVVVIAVVAVFAVRAVAGGGSDGSSSGAGSQDACPTIPTSSISPGGTTNDGRVHGGPVSYPELGAPWDAPSPDDRVPFGSDVLTQTVVIEPSYQPGKSWVASILVGQLLAGDGFYTPEDGSKIVVKCIVGAFYGDAAVTRDDKVNKAMTVDGHQAWIVESHLSFDIKGLQTKGELMIVVIVNAGETSGLYYASIPDTSPQLVQPARDALKNLTVD